MRAADNGFSGVIFDFGGVISRPQAPVLFDELAQRLGVECGALSGAYRSHRSEYDRGSLDGRGYWRAVLDACGAGVLRPEVEWLVARDTASWTVINAEVLDLARSLRASGRKLAILSNMPRDIGRSILRDHPWVEALFDALTFSGEIGTIKPEPAIYAHSLGQLGLEPAQCLFVDDTPGNVEAAVRLGLRGLHFSSASILAEDLRRAGWDGGGS